MVFFCTRKTSQIKETLLCNLEMEHRDHRNHLNRPYGNTKSVTKTLIIDDISPNYDLNWYNQQSMELIEIPIIPHDGIIKVENLYSNDVNNTLSSITILCNNTGNLLLESSLIMSVDLSDINLQNCQKIEFSLSI